MGKYRRKGVGGSRGSIALRKSGRVGWTSDGMWAGVGGLGARVWASIGGSGMREVEGSRGSTAHRK